MSPIDIESFKAIGSHAVQRAGDSLLSLFDKTVVLAEKVDGDWVTQADLQSDKMIRDVIQSSLPDARIVSEEDARQVTDLTGPTWIIDPLDGTHNFILGIPAFAVVLTLAVDGKPVLSIVNQPFTHQLYVAQAGSGATLNDKKLFISPRDQKNQLDTVCYVIGYTRRREAIFGELLLELRQHSKRVLELWAPSLSWCLVAQEKADSIICVHPSEFDAMGGALILKEAGGIITTSIETNADSAQRSHSSPSLVVGSTHQTVQQAVLAIVQGCLSKAIQKQLITL